MNEDRLISLETKIAYQDHLLEELNSVIYQQQKDIDNIQNTLTTLMNRLKDILNDGENVRGPNEKPPHY